MGLPRIKSISSFGEVVFFVEHPDEEVPQIIINFWDANARGEGREHAAALEYHRRLVYEKRYDYSPDQNHENWMEGLEGIFRNVYEAGFSGIRRLVPFFAEEEVDDHDFEDEEWDVFDFLVDDGYETGSEQEGDWNEE